MGVLISAQRPCHLQLWRMEAMIWEISRQEVLTRGGKRSEPTWRQESGSGGFEVYQWDQSRGGRNREEADYLREIRISHVDLSIRSSFFPPSILCSLCFYPFPVPSLFIALDRGSFLFEMILAFFNFRRSIWLDYLATAAP